MTYSPSQIETMARVFTTRQCEALAALELSFKTDADMFEAMLDQVADNIRLTEAGWDLFASTARLQFYAPSDTSENTRRHWIMIADAAAEEVMAEWNADAAEDRADYAYDLAREVA